jgi:hypothetical protein
MNKLGTLSNSQNLFRLKIVEKLLESVKSVL